MAKPTTRQELKDYALRQLGHPVLEINVADEQVDDQLDDALQLFYERHFDGVERVLLKYKITDNDIKRGRARGAGNTLGITTSSTGSGGSTTISGDTLWDDVILRQTFDGNFTDYAFGATAIVNDSTDVKTVASPVKVGTGALSLDGSSDHMRFAYDARYNFQGEWTFESWVYIDTSPSSGAIWSMSNSSFGGDIFGMLVDNSGGVIHFRWYNSEGTGNFNSTFGQSLGSYSPGSIVQNWVHVTLTRRASDGSIHLFINGVESSSTNSSQIIDNNIPDNSNMSLHIGARERSGDGRYLDGLFDDIRTVSYTHLTLPTTTPV